MKCNEVLERLDDYADDELDAASAAAVQRHLDGCRACSEERAAGDELRRQAAELPREIEPGRDLWPEIAQRLPAGRVASFGLRSRALLAAAAVLVLALTAVTAYLVGSRRAVVAERPGPSPRAVELTAVQASFESLGVTDYAETRAELMEVVAARRDELSPETLSLVMENLELIEQAMARIAEALGEDPGNELLQRQLVTAYRRQVDLLERAAVLPAEV